MVMLQDIEVFQLKAELCKTLADPRRLMIVYALRNGEKQVSELVKILNAPQAVVSRHLAILREHGVVTARRNGTTAHYSLGDSRISEACDLMDEVLLALMRKNIELSEKLMLQ